MSRGLKVVLIILALLILVVVVMLAAGGGLGGHQIPQHAPTLGAMGFAPRRRLLSRGWR